MTHEPECIWYDSPHECRLCEAIHAGYQRGRDDAAKALYVYLDGDWIKPEYVNRWASIARGNSQEEQSFKELIQHTQELGLYDIDTAEIVRDMRNRDNEIDNEH